MGTNGSTLLQVTEHKVQSCLPSYKNVPQNRVGSFLPCKIQVTPTSFSKLLPNKWNPKLNQTLHQKSWVNKDWYTIKRDLSEGDRETRNKDSLGETLHTHQSNWIHNWPKTFHHIHDSSKHLDSHDLDTELNRQSIREDLLTLPTILINQSARTSWLESY